MASSKFFVYNTAVKKFNDGSIQLNAGTIWAVPLHSGYTPSTASHSAYGNISNFRATASATVINIIQLANNIVTGSGATTNKFDSDNISGFSAGGDTFKCKYVALLYNTATAAAPIIGWYDTDTAASTGVEGTQVNVTVPAGGWFKFNSNA